MALPTASRATQAPNTCGEAYSAGTGDVSSRAPPLGPRVCSGGGIGWGDGKARPLSTRVMPSCSCSVPMVTHAPGQQCMHKHRAQHWLFSTARPPPSLPDGLDGHSRLNDGGLMLLQKSRIWIPRFWTDLPRRGRPGHMTHALPQALSNPEEQEQE